MTCLSDGPRPREPPALTLGGAGVGVGPPRGGGDGGELDSAAALSESAVGNAGGPSRALHEQAVQEDILGTEVGDGEGVETEPDAIFYSNVHAAVTAPLPPRTRGPQPPASPQMMPV